MVFFIAVRTVALAGAPREGAGAGDGTIRGVARGALMATGATAVSGEATRGTFAATGATVLSDGATRGTLAGKGATAVSDEGSASLPKYRRSVSGIVNSKPYLMLLDPRDAPWSVVSAVFVAHYRDRLPLLLRLPTSYYLRTPSATATARDRSSGRRPDPSVE